MPAQSSERDFLTDPSRMFINQKDGTFVESSSALEFSTGDRVVV